MTEHLWTRVDEHVVGRLHAPDPVLESVLRSSDAAGLPPIQVSAVQGKLLHLLARVMGARQVLEIGTLAGYSTIWLARALPAGGRLVSLEIDPRHAEVARANLLAAGLDDVAEVRVGPALESLPVLAQEGVGPFDLVFVDADKPSNAEYVRWALRLARPGTLVVVDNVVRSGGLVDDASADPGVLGSRAVVDYVAAEPRLDGTVLQTVGAKGYDGFLVALVTS